LIWEVEEDDAVVVVVEGKRSGGLCCSKGGLKLFTLHHPWPSPISPTRGDDLWMTPLSIFSDMLAKISLPHKQHHAPTHLTASVWLLNTLHDSLLLEVNL